MYEHAILCICTIETTSSYVFFEANFFGVAIINTFLQDYFSLPAVMGGGTGGGGGGGRGTGPPQTFQRLSLCLWAVHGKNRLQTVLVPPIVAPWRRPCLQCMQAHHCIVEINVILSESHCHVRCTSQAPGAARGMQVYKHLNIHLNIVVKSRYSTPCDTVLTC